MRSDEQSWDALIDPRFSLLELNSSRGRQIQYLDMATGWRGDVGLRLGKAAEALDRPIGPERPR
jgi:hypothetical protein